MSFVPKNFTVWIEIPVSDLDASMQFYAAVTGGALVKQQMGPNLTAVFQTADDQGVAGHLYEGTPSQDGRGPTVHLHAGCGLEEAMDKVWEGGGTVLGAPETIPDGRVIYLKDPDGNSIGLFEYVEV